MAMIRASQWGGGIATLMKDRISIVPVAPVHASSRLIARVAAPISGEQLQTSEPDSAPAVKYPHLPCSSPCAPGDTRCQEVEAVIQHVLNFPRMPTRLCQWLPSIGTDMSVITATIEGLARKYGQELTVHILKRAPHILLYDFDTLVSRADQMRTLLDLRPTEVDMMLRKNPLLLCLESGVVKSRYMALHKVLPLAHEGVKALVKKNPMILSWNSSSVEEAAEALRQACCTRVQWQEDFENITPSVLSAYLDDCIDILNRLDYLNISGASPFVSLRDVIKSTNSMFARKHRGFTPWRIQRDKQAKQRQQVMMQRQQRMAAAQQSRTPSQQNNTAL